MKKEYLEAPDYEIIIFETEDIMDISNMGGYVDETQAEWPTFDSEGWSPTVRPS